MQHPSYLHPHVMQQAYGYVPPAYYVGAWDGAMVRGGGGRGGPRVAERAAVWQRRSARPPGSQAAPAMAAGKGLNCLVAWPVGVRGRVGAVAPPDAPPPPDRPPTSRRHTLPSPPPPPRA